MQNAKKDWQKRASLMQKFERPKDYRDKQKVYKDFFNKLGKKRFKE